MARFRQKQPLLINAGHFGGDLPKVPATAQSENKWPEEFARFMAKPEGVGFFGDLGYWTALRSCESGNNDCQNARGRLSAAIAAFPEATKRIMYGTDWFMISKETNWPAYAELISRNLQGILPDKYFLYRNAISLFGLGHHGQNRHRLEGRFGQIPGGVPKWLAEA